MQIEEKFRDMKNGRWGLGLEYSRSSNPQRLENLLVIGTLGIFVFWLNGLIAKSKGWIKRYSVLSIFFLGKRVVNDKLIKFTLKDFNSAFRELSICAYNQVDFVGIH